MPNRRQRTVRLVQLEALVAFADCGNMTKAGKELQINKSTVGRYIVDLEIWLSCLLVSEGELTADGVAFVPVARSIIAALYGAQNSTTEPGRSSVPPAPASAAGLDPYS